jgi:putative ABC transport system substrate-binding protein
MRRREFLGFLGATWAFPRAVAAQSTKARTVGLLALGNPNPERFFKSIAESLKTLGYVDGQNIRLEFRSAEGRADALHNAAAELVRLKVDVIVAWQNGAVTAAKLATNEIPIVMAGAGDPLGTGLIASLARPGGNITGTSGFGPELGGKCVELVREMLPSARRVAVLAAVADTFADSFLAQIERSGRSVGIEVDPIMVQPSDPLDSAFAEMRSKSVDAVIIQPTLLRQRAAELALKNRLPSLSVDRMLPAAGGLISYSSDQAELFHQTALYIDEILKGSKPGELPVARPNKFELVINQNTARALGLTFPPSLLARADEVIE